MATLVSASTLNDINSTSTQRPITAIALIIGSAVLFSVKVILIKLSFRYGVSTISVLLLRLLFALPIYLLILFLFQRSAKSYIASKKTWLHLMFLSFIGFYISSFLDFHGLNYLPAGLERIIMFSNPAIVLILGYLFFKIKITGIQILSTAICYLGIVIAFVNQVEFQGGSNLSLGAMFIFGATITYACYLIFSERILQKIPAVFFTCTVMIFSAVFATTHYFVTEEVTTLFQLDNKVYFYCILMAIFATVIPTFMLAEGIKRIGAGNTAILSGVSPISTIILAAFILDEHFSFWQYVGTFFVLAGVYILTLKTKKSKTSSRSS